MAWIESHQGLPKHPKTKKLIRKLRIPGPLAVGHLHYLWWWALDFAQDGEITQYDPFDIADACEWKGDPDEFYNALIDAGFVDAVDERHFIHDWYDYAGKLIEIRKKDAERKRKSRGHKQESEGIPEDVQRTSEGRRTESIRDLDLNLNLKELYIAQFDEFWKLYPSKKGKAKAQAKWMILAPKLDFEKVMQGTRDYIKFIEHGRANGKNRDYKDGATYVNGQNWEDDWTINNLAQFDSKYRRPEKEVVSTPVEPMTEEEWSGLNDAYRKRGDNKSVPTAVNH